MLLIPIRRDERLTGDANRFIRSQVNGARSDDRRTEHAHTAIAGNIPDRLGDNVRVKVARIYAFRSEIDFELIER